MPAARSSFLGENLNVDSAVSATSLISVTGDDDDRTPYERVLYGLHHDQRWLKEITLGRRVGFYRFRGELGQGNFSTVRLALHQLTRDKVAVKVIDKAKLDQKTQRMLAREIANMDAVAHPNIIRLFEVVETLSRIHLVLEFAPGGELFNRITADGRLTEHDSAKVFTQVLAAITYLHGLSIIHRDIKAENVFIAGPGIVKLGDFGFSTRVTSLAQQLSTFCGSPPYAAPELYKDESYQGPAVDIWALGVLLFFILTADMPFKANTVAGLKRHILAGSFVTPDFVSPAANDLINRLLVQDPSERPSPQIIASHTWLSKAPDPPTPLPSHVLTPRLSAEDISSAEEETITSLEKWGINRDSLEEGAPMGARSPAIATYRIMLHRLLTQANTPSKVSNNNSVETTTTSATSTTPTSSPCKEIVVRRPKLRLRNGLASSAPGGVKSKACNIV
ncbi:serine/threonine-protein kinase NIM1-like isoform X1 [Palaemon carinicauda]|uniref:serine/threonine-protein kinase NIM1-like isoform X1 n=1 Tax=Palaemon carinicauda TaxID=392227 RepID=UPI0035B60A15